jgi:prolipoprotein diacylglyceryltransferase
MIELTWDVDPVWFHLGVIQVRYYSVCFILALFGGYALFSWQVVRGGGDIEEAGDFLTYGFLGALAGARLGHVLFYGLEHALSDPIWVLQIYEIGLGLLVLGLLFYFDRKWGKEQRWRGAMLGLFLTAYCVGRFLVEFVKESDAFDPSLNMGSG